MPCLLVCTGKDCRSAKGFDALRDMAADVSGAVGVPCQGICDGPVVGVRVHGEVRWFAEVRGGKARRQVKVAIDERDVAKGLRRLEVRGHRGKVEHPKKATRLKR